MIRHAPQLAKKCGVRAFKKEVELFFKNIVRETVKIRDEQGIVRPDMIQLFMETRDTNRELSFDINEMSAQAFIFFLAGFDTVSTTICFAQYELAVNPDVQKKLRIEIENVLKETNGKLTYEVVNNQKYLDAVIKEVLRLYPMTSFLDRICVKDFEMPPATPDGKPFTIKPGEYILFPNFSLHRDPKYFPEPDKFNPERFLNSDVDNSVYIPFGIGPRICIARRFAIMEIKIILFYLLSRCDLEPDVKTKVPMVLDTKTILTSSDGGFWLKLRSRETTISIASYLLNEQTVNTQT